MEQIKETVAKDLLKIKAVFFRRTSRSPGQAASKARFTATTG